MDMQMQVQVSEGKATDGTCHRWADVLPRIHIFGAERRDDRRAAGGLPSDAASNANDAMAAKPET